MTRNDGLLIGVLLLASPGVAVACGVAATPVVFGNYSVFDASPTYSTGGVTVNCAQPYTIKISASSNGGGFSPRQLDSAGNRLNYYLFTDATYTTVWGDGTSGTSTVAGSGSAESVLHTIYGRLPAQQNVPSGSYSDSLTVTLEW